MLQTANQNQQANSVKLSANLGKAAEDQDVQVTKEQLNTKRAGDCSVSTMETTNSIN